MEKLMIWKEISQRTPRSDSITSRLFARLWRWTMAILQRRLNFSKLLFPTK
jgi:hypothetical protein